MKSKVSFLNRRNDDELRLRERASVVAKKFTQILRSKDDLQSNLYEDSGPFLEVDVEKNQKKPPKSMRLSISRLTDGFQGEYK